MNLSHLTFTELLDRLKHNQRDLTRELSAALDAVRNGVPTMGEWVTIPALYRAWLKTHVPTGGPNPNQWNTGHPVLPQARKILEMNRERKLTAQRLLASMPSETDLSRDLTEARERVDAIDRDLHLATKALAVAESKAGRDEVDQLTRTLADATTRVHALTVRLKLRRGYEEDVKRPDDLGLIAWVDSLTELEAILQKELEAVEAVA
jgi:hypothetical protein